MGIDAIRIKAICFDVDGTLSDTDDQFVLKMSKWLSPLRTLTRPGTVPKISRKLVMFTEGPGNWVYSLADKVSLDGQIVALGDRLYRMGIGNSPQPFRLIPGIKGLLESLHNQYKLAIISIRGQRSTHLFLHQFDLENYFSVVVTGQTCNHTKPYPDPILWAASKMEVPADACIMVGDTMADILAGKRAGAQTAGVLCGFGEKKELERAGADLILPSTTDIADFLLKPIQVG